ncbi:MAG: DUF3617 domain-containing protein [Usitatibacter sp.]
MSTARIIAIACCAATGVALAAGNPFDSFKGKMKEGMYEYKMEMDMGAMPGMPAGMGKQNMTFQKCITAHDIEKGQMGRGDRNGKMPESCEIKNFSQSGNTASYTMECKEPPMSADNRITFKNDGFTMDMKMAMNQRGQAMNMTQHMESRYLGPCK